MVKTGIALASFGLGVLTIALLYFVAGDKVSVMEEFSWLIGGFALFFALCSQAED